MSALILLSGEICSGKTSVAEILRQSYSFVPVSTGKYLKRVASQRKIEINRKTLQSLGDILDYETNFRWLVDLANLALEVDQSYQLLLDCIRKIQQLQIFRSEFPGILVHAHLHLPRAVAEQRYIDRQARGGEYDDRTSFAEAKESPTENAVVQLRPLADWTGDTSKILPNQCAAEIARITVQFERNKSSH